ncbi:AfsR/SARP family transcriptional regulator [Catellatospora tritici]|uniref:AfsR/SARP family transcriptional regulator n=1 Tax=Catellatospora tritici TaxID=2851566 RepID=UPI001C2D23A3|nr:BTAD domain-containing putative transcriptional regulator [Catellatospora tritici]MBV1856486.1 tetratricopeptide repeat protein [Catellatospora tritici]
MPPTGSAPTEPPPRIRLLGPIEVTGPAGPAVFTGNRQPALVGLLALGAPDTVSRTWLVDGLWGDEPPRTAVKTLHSHIARLRQALDDCGLVDLVHTNDSGYQLAIDPAAVDTHRFEREVRLARGELAEGADPAAVSRLHRALDLWRGDAFAGAEAYGWAAGELVRLEEVRLAALCDLWEGELRLGRHTVAVGELQRLLTRYPFHERLVGLALLALYRCGRTTDALNLYHLLRVHLREELGAEPGSELAVLYVQMLRRDPALDHHGPPTVPVTSPLTRPRPRPAELPGSVGHFIGRRAELAQLDAVVADPDVRVVVISGAAGMGKTALAVQWGHRAAADFPDGQVFLDLRGHDPAVAMPPAEALAHVLTSLDQPDRGSPADEPDRVGLYRSLTRDRRMLILADNAGTVAQILPLVPANTGTLLVVTSRHRLTALKTHHAVKVIDLDALRPDEALNLLDAVLGTQRLAREPDSAVRLVELCDRMPLALQIAAAKLTSRPMRDIADLTDELTTGERLDELSVEGDSRNLRAVFATTYEVLEPVTARVFRALGVHPGTTFGPHLAAAAADVAPTAARRALDELAAVHLVTEVANGRYRFHDLIRLYARECAHRGESEQVRADIVARILDWYLAIADAANKIVDRGRDRVRVVVGHPPATLPFRAEADQALSFLDGERDNLQPILTCAMDHGRPDVAWQMTYLVTGFFDSRGHWTQRIQLCRLGLAAARAAGDPVAEGLMGSGLGVAYLTTRRFDEALTTLNQALEVLRAQGDKRGEAHVRNNLAVTYASARRFAEAVDAYGQALALHLAEGNTLGVALTLSNLGDAYVRMGRADLALDHLSRALAASREIGNPRLEAAALGGLGQAHRDRGEWDLATARFHDALILRRQAGDRRYEAETLNNLGLTEFARQRFTSATERFLQSLALSRELADPHQEAIALAHLGRIALAAGEVTAAGEYLSRALAARELAPDPYEAAAIHRDLGQLAARAGRSPQARHHHELAVDLFRQVDAVAAASADAD